MKGKDETNPSIQSQEGKRCLACANLRIRAIYEGTGLDTCANKGS